MSPKRIFEKIYPYLSFIAQAFYQLIFDFFVLEKWKRGWGEFHFSKTPYLYYHTLKLVQPSDIGSSGFDFAFNSVASSSDIPTM